jgi:hypothetical protein
MSRSDESIHIELSCDAVENLKLFSELLGKDINSMIDEALTQYFTSEQKRLLEKNIEDDSMMTNLDFDEFWGGVDI